jgi:WhiB family redox-sensing transcriptional regulator
VTVKKIRNTENFDPIYGKDVAWMKDAACLGMDVDLFFPEDGQNLSVKARNACKSCTVRSECYIYAEQHFIDHGTFGGMTAQQRHDQRRVIGRTSKKFQEMVSW